MSDVIVSTTESTTDVTTTNDVTTVAITNTVVEISQATAGLQGVPGSNSDPSYVFVTNKTGATLAKGSIVYVSGANGTHTQVSLALATGDVTSARTLGWLAENIANNATGLCCVEGYLDGINTQGITEGAQLYLSPTVPGGFTQTKPGAPDHMVYVGICAKASAGNGRVFVHVQNGAELEELHDVKIVSPANNDLLRYVAGTALWENVASTAITVGSAITAGTSVYATNAGTSVYATNAGTSVYSATSGTSVYATNAGTSVYASTAGTSVYATNAGTAVDLSGSITKSQVSDFTSGTVASAGTAQQAGTAVTISGSITRSQVSDFTSGTVTSASTAQTAGTASFASTASSATNAATAVSLSGSITISQITDLANGTVAIAGTANFANQAGTATYSTTSGSALTITGSITKSQVSDFTSGTVTTISGSITRSQVSDYASGTVANISGTVTQSQVTNLTTSLASKAGTADNNTFTGLNTFSNFTTFQAAADAIPIRIFGANGQSADLFSVNDYLTNTQFEILSDGRAQSLAGIITTVGSTASIPLVVRGTAGQSAAITVWQNSGSTAIATVSPLGYGNFTRVTAGSTADLGYAVLSVNTGATATIGAVIRGASGQSADLLQIQNSGSTAVVRMDNSGQVIMNALGVSGSPSGISYAYFTTPSASAKPVVVRGAASQSANLQEWQSSSGGTVLSVNSAGLMTATRQFAINSGNAGETLLVVRGASSQTGDQIAVRDSNANTIAGFSATGRLYSGVSGSGQTYLGGLNLGSVNTVATQLGVIAGTATTVGAVIRGAASQSADLTQWQNSGGTSVGSLSIQNTGGAFTLLRGTAAVTNPGANNATLYFVAGTNANTLKLVVRAGAAGAETTILDNIPT